ncbi:photosystem ii reaction center protein k [Phtheirospermum japonicum]|uniref:Photosystem ii reaction center protein k n=1 Tax=Phtheirospermum japonicum TaxID=374723 RepID=A0A830B4W5_9LAMI|nr:photosystem ii reaction center protein k [Phtheirospermum japonicum]
MYVMLNIISLICINFTLYSSSFSFFKFPETYYFFNQIVYDIPVIHLFHFSLSYFFWKAAVTFL